MNAYRFRQKVLRWLILLLGLVVFLLLIVPEASTQAMRSIGKQQEKSVQIEETHDTDSSRVLIVVTCLLLHPVLWGGLFLGYPASRHFRMFFWNPYIRKIFGLGYIHLLLTKVPYFRQQLFEPFRASLLIDAVLNTFDDATYFKQTEVTEKHTGETHLTYKVIPEITGKIVLEGPSGAGKSMFARYLMKHATRVTVYLLAEKCSNGIIEAIQSKLRGEVRDRTFLKALIDRGAIDICIDGLHRVDEEHVKMIQFMMQSFKGNILLTTQPLNWVPPVTAHIYVIQPLRRDYIEDFLIGCYHMFPEHIVVPYAEYVQACHTYLADVLNEQQSGEMGDTVQQILSNPMNLTMVALLGAYEKRPDLLHLSEQYYHLMREEYEHIHQDRVFPLVRFSECVYQMRLNDESTLPQNRFPDEIACMERYGLVLSRQSSDSSGNLRMEWYFRHDKIMDFFLAHAFLSSSHTQRCVRHVNDSRFQGVYPLLEGVLSPDVVSQASQLQNTYNPEFHEGTKEIIITEFIVHTHSSVHVMSPKDKHKAYRLGQGLTALALIDSGAAVNILPHEPGLEPGLSWESQDLPL